MTLKPPDPVTGSLDTTFSDYLNDVDILKESPLNVQDTRFSHLVSGSDWTAVFLAAKALLPLSGGEIYVPYLSTGYTITQTIEIGKGQRWFGAGGNRNNNVSTIPFATTQINFTNDGPGFQATSGPAQAWSIEKMYLRGDLANTSQDLLVCGTGTAVGGGYVRDVAIENAGRDGLRLDFCLNTTFDRVYTKANGRNGVFTTSQSNANDFRKLISRENKQWGVRIEGGKGLAFYSPTIESNSLDTVADYGGILVNGASWHCLVSLFDPYFENNDGIGGTGPSIQTDSPVNIPLVLKHFGGTFSETAPLILNGGRYITVGETSQIQPVHAVLGTTLEGAHFGHTRRWGTGASIDGKGSLVVTDAFGKGTADGDGIAVPSVASAAAITIPINPGLVNITGVTTITSIVARPVGYRVTLMFAGILTLTDGSNLKLAGNFVTSADDSITLISDGTNWIETGRSVN